LDKKYRLLPKEQAVLIISLQLTNHGSHFAQLTHRLHQILLNVHG